MSKAEEERMNTAKTNAAPATPTSPTVDLSTNEIVRRYRHSTSEELGKVLGVISGELDFGLAGETPVLEKSTTEAAAASDYGLTLVRNLTFLTGPLKIEKRLIDLSQTCMDTYQLFERFFVSRMIRPNMVVDSQKLVEADANAIHQIVSCLLIRAGRTVPANCELSLSLKQSAKDTEILYTDNAPTTITGGDDPDLALARLLVQTHGGTIDRVIKAGVGNGYSIRLPYDTCQPQPTGAVHRRRNRRATVSLKVTYAFPNSAPVVGRAVNLSVAGVYIQVPDPGKMTPPEQGSPMNLRVHCFWNTAIEIPTARVANVRWAGPTAGFGVEFGDIDSRARKILASIVKSHPY